MKRILLFLFVALCAANSLWAYDWDFRSEGLYYNIINDTVAPYEVEVTYQYKDDANNYSGLKTVNIPTSVVLNGDTFAVTSIGKYAFYKCSGLTSITIPESVTSIGMSAFCGCKDLTSITIPESVTSIGQSAFYGCSGFTSVTIPESVTSIGMSAFERCSGLISIVVENGNSVYDSRNNCNAIIETATNTLVVGCPNTIILDDITSIGHYAFCGCTGLTSITIPESVTSIGYNAFYGCTGLTSITIPESVTRIRGDAFRGCSGLTSITIPKSVTSIGKEAFSSCSGITSIIWNSKNYPDLTFTSKIDLFGRIRSQITSFTFGNEVEHIPAYLCYNMSKLTSITIPESVTSIGKEAFSSCSGITSITWNAKNCSETGIDFGEYLFPSRNVISFVFGNKVEHIPAYLCYNMSKLTSITIPDGVTSIGKDAFSYCEGLTSITIPESVTSIGDYAFGGCSGLTSIIWNAKNCGDFECTSSNGGDCSLYGATVPSQITSFVFGNKVEHIPAYLCYNMSKLTSITIPESVTSIGKCAFSGCTGLISITIPESVTSIGWDAFRYVLNVVYHGSAFGAWGARNVNGYVDGCLIYNDATKTQLLGCSSKATGKITIPNSVTSIGESAFHSCTDLTSITIPSSVTYIGQQAFAYCFDLTSITIPESVTSIGRSAFEGCTGLTSITIPDGVTSIGYSAFSGCTGLTSVTIPNSVTSIGSSAFYKCTGLTSITMEASTPPTVSNIFDDDSQQYSKCTLYVPCGSLSAYQKANEWKNFQYIQEPPVPFSISVKANATQEGTARLESEPTCSNMEATISATPKTGYRFTHWSDGNTDNPRAIVLTQDTALTAYFEEIPTYAVSLSCDAEQGTVSGGGTYQEGKQVSVSATPKTGYRFTHWNDGNTDNPRTIVLTQDTVLTAYFEQIPMYAVSLSCDAKQGTVSGGGTYQEGEQVSISATPKTGYRFTHWSDGNTDNPRTIVLTQDTALTAIFEMVTYDVMLACDVKQGSVSGGGTYREGEQITVSAMPNEGYEFVQWSDGNTDNPRSWIVTEDVSLSAIFQQVTALPQTTAASQETQKVVKDGQVLILRNGKAYNMLGQEIR